MVKLFEFIIVYAPLHWRYAGGSGEEASIVFLYKKTLSGAPDTPQDQHNKKKPRAEARDEAPSATHLLCLWYNKSIQIGIKGDHYEGRVPYLSGAA